MKIDSMTATFGKLDGDTLQLKDGFNLITAPNEWGKSTWCAFLTAMLYGIDTKERSSKTQLSLKEHYTPWSGKPMSGILRIRWKNRDITIERHTKGRIPLGDFKAYETGTGIQVSELNSSNCGQVLLGVERSVFVRTGLIRFTDLPVQQDDALRSRLNALVTTGDESGSGDLLARKLREYKNRCRYHKVGLIPEVQDEIQSLLMQKDHQSNLRNQYLDLQQQIQKAQVYVSDLENHLNVLDHEVSVAASEEIENARAMVIQTQEQTDDLERQCKKLPLRSELAGKLAQANALMEQIDQTPVIQKKSRFPAFLLWFAASFLLFISGYLGYARHMEPSLLVLAAGLVFLIWGAAISYRTRKYELERTIEEHRIEDRHRELRAQTLLWRQQYQLVSQLEQLRRENIEAKLHLQNLISQTQAETTPLQADTLTLSREQTQQELRRTRSFLESARVRLGQLQGQMDASGDFDRLSQQLQTARSRLAQLEQTYRALDYGQKALEAAMQELQRRFAPQITHRASYILERLTGGRYHNLCISEDLSLQSSESQNYIMHSPLWTSDGTADQMYLALRIAVWETLTPTGPLILDDALLRFDDSRLQSVLSLLKELSETRQILLFSCQDREKRFLNL